MSITVGSICSGIEAASVAWEPLGMKFSWFSEISDFPSQVLKVRYPQTTNLGDMNNIPELINKGTINAPDLICGGTPCQAFSLAGRKKGLKDDRGNLTLKFVDIIEANDKIRLAKSLPKTIIFWENVEGVLTDKTNAFGCLISSLAGFEEVIENVKWASSGIVYGPQRNVAWRVLDAKYFGVPQQRRRLYLLAGGLDFHPENILFEKHEKPFVEFPKQDLIFDKEGHRFEIFREYTDCLYAAYGTKWNGNAAATNGSLFVVQDNRIRRLSPLECERLMGFPDNYTELNGVKKTNRYQAIGNSWAVPVVRWIGERILNYPQILLNLDINDFIAMGLTHNVFDKGFYIPLGKEPIRIFTLNDTFEINCTSIPERPIFGNMNNIVSSNASKDIYISPVGCHGIIRRKIERNSPINKRLEEILITIAKEMSFEEIERKSKIQKKGRSSKYYNSITYEQINQTINNIHIGLFSN